MKRLTSLLTRLGLAMALAAAALVYAPTINNANAFGCQGDLAEEWTKHKDQNYFCQPGPHYDVSKCFKAHDDMCKTLEHIVDHCGFKSALSGLMQEDWCEARCPKLGQYKVGASCANGWSG